ncbi:MAG: 30S ribosome-binding factor RbfA [Acidobacteriia bacterium]|nr:30S ribosome-binding factor RbfA [Terriglobia bacterium]
MKPSGRRPEQVADLVRMMVGQMLVRDLKDPRIGFTTITGVKMSPDLHVARIYVSVLGDVQVRQQTLEALQAARGFIRHELGRELRLRITPELHFQYDPSVEYGAHIEEVIQKIHHPEEKDKEKQK